MNKKRKIKLKVLIITIFSILIISVNNIYAVGLRIEADINEENGDVVSAVFRSYSKTASSVDVSANEYNKWYTLTNPPTSGGESWYNTNTTYFQKDFYLSNYSKDNSSGALKVRYDVIEGGKILATGDANADKKTVNSFLSALRYVTKNNNLTSKSKDIITITGNAGKVKRFRYRYIKYNDTTDISVVEYKMNRALLDQIIEKYENTSCYNKSENRLEVKFSLAVATTRNNKGLLKTAYDAAEEMYDGWHPRNLGFKDYNYDTLSDGTSVLNHYDNILYIPMNKFNKRKVTIRYLMQDTNGDWKEFDKQQIQIEKDAYTVKKSKTIPNGKYYTGNNEKFYLGVRWGQGSTYDNAKQNAKDTTANQYGWETTSVTIPASDDEKEYVVDFMYSPRKVTEKHLKTDGSAIVNATTTILSTREEITLRSKEPFYHNNTKYVHVQTKEYRKGELHATTTDDTIYYGPLDGTGGRKNGKKTLVFPTFLLEGRFYYEVEEPRKVYIRHYVYNTNTNQVSRNDNLKNSTEPVYDHETNTTTARQNGFNQRKFKSGASNYIDSVASGFSEQFTIDKADSMQVNKSSTEKEAKDGNATANGYIRYKYVGANKANVTAPATITNRIQIEALAYDNPPVNVEPQDVEKTYVDMYYIRLEPRKVKIRYIEIVDEKDTPQNRQNNDQLLKEETKFVDGQNVQQLVVNKASMDSIKANTDRLYIGGSIGIGTRMDDAEADLKTSPDSWGWNQTSYTIPALFDEEQYVIEFYYDHREMTERHLKTDGSNLDPSWNKATETQTNWPRTQWPRTQDKVTMEAKYTTVRNNQKSYHIYYQDAKYKYVYTEYDGNRNIRNKPILEFSALSGANALKFGDSHYGYFYYEFEPARKVRIRHFAYNTNTKSFERPDKLTNEKENVTDFETGTTTARPNGYNQRKYKTNPNGNYIDRVDSGYNEQFTIDRADTMTVNRSALEKELKNPNNRNDGWIRYKFVGFVKQDERVPTPLTTRAQAEALNNKTLPVNIGAQSVDNTFVDMYYVRLEPRTVTIRYVEIVGEKDTTQNRQNNDIVLKTEKFTLDLNDIEERTVTRQNIDNIKANTDRLYIGGSIGIGEKIADAENDLKNSPDSWGWNTNSYKIPALFDEEQYVIEFYYDHREMLEKHLKTDGTDLNPAWNRYTETELNWPRASWPRTQDSVTMEAKYTIMKNNVKSYHTYYQAAKYNYVYTEYNGNKNVKNAPLLEFGGLSGSTSLRFGDSNYGYFYYEFEPPRIVRIRHFAYNTNTKVYERPDKLTNKTENVTDFETEITTARENGYNQRKLKSGYTDYIDPVDSGYNEQFTIDRADSMTVNRSAHEKELKNPDNREDGWIRYKYLGHIKSDERPPIELKTRAEAEALNDKSLPVNVGPKVVDNTFVDMYYVRLEPRTVTIRYVEIVGEKDTPQNGEKDDIVIKTKKYTLDLDEIAEDIVTRENIDNIKPNTDRLYIGGSIGIGEKIADAENDLKNSPDSWGWNTDTYKIPALFDEEQYVIEFYYDHREMTEKHLKTNGADLNTAWNRHTETEWNWPRAQWPRTQDSVTMEAKNTIRANDEKKYYTYYDDAKWQYIYTEYDGNKNIENTPLLEFGGLSGDDSLKFGDRHYGYFYYEFVNPTVVYVRHFVYDKESDSYKISDKLTNTHASVWDYDEMIYYLRPNGFNQRKWKCEHPSVDNVASGYNEQYTIDMNDIIKIDKSLRLSSSKVKYEYQGCEVIYETRGARSPSEVLNMSGNELNKVGRVTIEPKNKEYVCVDFYYIPKKILPPGGEDPEGPIPGVPDPEDPDDPPNDEPDPTIDFIPKKEDDKTTIGIDTGTLSGDCRTTYVPTGETLKSYVTAVKYKPYTLVYESVSVNKNTGKITYKLKDYEVYKYIEGLLKNFDDSTTYGKFNSTDKEGVFNWNSDTSVIPNADVINTAIEDSITDFATMDPTEIETIKVGDVTKEVDYDTNTNTHKVNEDKYNGIRKVLGTANYQELTLYTEGNRTNVSGNTVQVETKDNAQVNVYTPVGVAEIASAGDDKTVIKSAEIVNHSDQDGAIVIQKNAEFSVTPRALKISSRTTGGAYGDNLSNPEKYIKHYWFIADFNIRLSDGTIIEANNPIKIEKGQTFKGVATSGFGNEEGKFSEGDIVSNLSNKMRIIAVAINTPDSIQDAIASKINAEHRLEGLVDSGFNKIQEVTCDESGNGAEIVDVKKNHHKLSDDGSVSSGETAINMYYDALYMADAYKTSKNIGRIYGFKVTDCLDVNMKNIFRKNVTDEATSEVNVNNLRGIQYFSGIRKLLIYGGNSGDNIYIGGNSNNQYNVYLENSDINQNGVQTILPFGPYKHIDQNYLQAPKLGYRISFDVKTSGFYTKGNELSKRYVTIKPSYYYISKSGGQPNFDIKLYYKNSAGKYVHFENSGYNISFKPNDGYRTHFNTPETNHFENMSTKLETLSISKEFTLTDDMMSYSENGFVQAWYGEFKLPNSTIAVANGSDINNPLKDGYIGVIFDIKCIDESSDGTEKIVVSYNQGDKNVGGHANTTQWDYEGYLGYPASNNGADYSTSLQLERGIWQISGDIYKKIKGTVVLYDIDNRAAEDFD